MIRKLLFSTAILLLLSATTTQDELIGYWELQKVVRKNDKRAKKEKRLPVYLLQFEENGVFRAGMRGTKNFRTGSWTYNKETNTVSISGMNGSSPEAMKIIKLTSRRIVFEDKRARVYMKKL